MKMIPHSWMCNYFAGKGEFYFDPLFNKHGWERKEIMYYDNKITDCFILPNYKPSGQVKQTILYDDITRDIENGNF